MAPKKPTSDRLRSTKERERVVQKRGPKKGFGEHQGDRSRAEYEQEYENPVNFSVLVQNETIKEVQLAAFRKVWQILFDAEIMDSKTQFCAMILHGVMTPIPIADAAAICNCGRGWFHKLDREGRIQIIRADRRHLYLRADDVTRILQGRV